MTYLSFWWDSFVAFPSLNSISYWPLPITETCACQHFRITETTEFVCVISPKCFHIMILLWGQYSLNKNLSCSGFPFRNCVVELDQQCAIYLRIREEFGEKQYLKGKFNLFISDS